MLLSVLLELTLHTSVFYEIILRLCTHTYIFMYMLACHIMMSMHYGKIRKEINVEIVTFHSKAGFFLFFFFFVFLRF